MLDWGGTFPAITHMTLISLAMAEFGNLTPGEARIMLAIAKGERATLDEDAGRTVRAAVIVWLCTAPRAMGMVHTRGLSVSKALINERIDLGGAKIPFRLSLRDSEIPGGMDLSDSHVMGLSLWGTKVGAIDASRLQCEGELVLRDGFTVNGKCSLANATVGGSINAIGGKFLNAGGTSLGGDGLRVRGAVVLRTSNEANAPRFESVGELRLGWADIGGNLEMDGAILSNEGGNCFFGYGMKIAGNAHLRALDSSRFPFEATGRLAMPGAQIGGDLSFEGAKLSNSKGETVFADRCRVTGRVLLRTAPRPGSLRFESQGEARLAGAEVQGDVDCRGGSFTNPGGRALSASHANISANLLMCTEPTAGSPRFEAKGSVQLHRARVAGLLDCTGASLHCDHDDCLGAHGIKVGNWVRLRAGQGAKAERFSASGQVQFSGATVSGGLDCGGGSFHHSNGPCLNLEAARIELAVLLRAHSLESPPFQASGQVRLFGTFVGGDLDCQGALLANADGASLFLFGATVRGNILLRENFRAEGRVALSGLQLGDSLLIRRASIEVSRGPALEVFGTSIGGRVAIDGGTNLMGGLTFASGTIAGRLQIGSARLVGLPNEQGDGPSNALSLVSSTIGGDAELSGSIRQPFTAGGRVHLNDAEFKRNLCIDFTKIEGQPQRAQDAALSLRRASVQGQFTMGDHLVVSGSVDLTGATVGRLDDSRSAWPTGAHLRLDGFTYGALSDRSPYRAAERLEWLNLRPSTSVSQQPYEQLARVLREVGHGDEAFRILIAGERRRGRDRSRSRPWRIMHRMYGLALGYGYEPWRPLVILVACFLFGIAVFGYGFDHGLIVRTRDLPRNSGVSAAAGIPAAGYPAFFPISFSAGNLLPLVNLRASEYWMPDSNASFREGHTGWTISGTALMYYLWFHSFVGWVATSLLLVGLSKLVRRS